MEQTTDTLATFDIIAGPSLDDLQVLRAVWPKPRNQRRFNFAVKARDEKSHRLLIDDASPATFIVILQGAIELLEDGYWKMKAWFEQPDVTGSTGATVSCTYDPDRQQGNFIVRPPFISPIRKRVFRRRSR